MNTTQAYASAGGAVDTGLKPSPPPAVDPALAEALAEVSAERDDFLDALRRLQAEFDNFRNRAQRERAAESKRAVVETLRHLLPAFDALDAARARHPDVVDPVRQVLDTALQGLDVQQLGSVGDTFDPQLHDAVEMVEPATAEGAAQGAPVVREVLRPGYRCRDQLVRPATVRVAATNH